MLGQKWLYSGTSACIWAKVDVFVQIGVKLQSGCIRAKVVVLGQKWFYSGTLVLLKQK